MVDSTPLSILKSHGIKASKKLGQNFLNDPTVVRKIIKAASPLKNEIILEIGPGLGILTRELLLELINKLICVEYDQRCINYLQANLLSNGLEKLFIINEDALKLEEESLLKNGQRPIIVSNLPYNISTMLLLKWLKKIYLFKKMILMFQKEVAERICAPPYTKQYGILSVLTQFLCFTQLKFDVPRSAFFPKPKVTSSVISIVPKENLKGKLQIYKKLERLCKTVFNKRRKTLKNSISSILENPEESLLNIGIDAGRRPETLSVEEFELIVRKLKFYESN
jgi:16S rRNA (adenine1518-N6/adenine1519-N6)-dimethyltransferase